MFREIAVPVIVSIVVGVGSSYMATNVAIAVLNEQVGSLKTEMTNMQDIVKAVAANQIELAARGEWISSTDNKLLSITQRLDKIEHDEYTAVDAQRDMSLIMREIDLRHRKVNEDEF